MNGLIFNLQRFSTKDGPGIRTTVFLKGCNLNCLWCHNPESINGHKELKYLESHCVHCGSCASACPENCITVAVDDWTWDESLCTFCGDCVKACPQDALGLWGVEYSPQALVDELIKDRDYYSDSGGGVTFSGGEAVLQAEFLRECMSLLKEEGIHTAIDTALSTPWSVFKEILPLADLFLIDVKGMDIKAHIENIGIDPSIIWDNIRKMKRHINGPEVHVRIPLVKDRNDDPEGIPAMIELLKDWPSLTRVELLSYHSLGADKAAQLITGYTQDLFKAPDSDRMDEFRQKLASSGLPVTAN